MPKHKEAAGTKTAAISTPTIVAKAGAKSGRVRRPSPYGAAAKKIDGLREEIRKNDYLYYVLDSPKISDASYDKLMVQLKGLEAGRSIRN